MLITANVRGDIMREYGDDRIDWVERRRLALTAAAILARKAFGDNFRAGGRPPWAPLAESTIRQKLAMYNAGMIRGRNAKGNLVSLRRMQPMAPGALYILIRTGDLMRAVTRRGVKGNITRIDPISGTLEIGTNLVYAGTHQYGNPSKNIPARPYLTLTEADEQNIIETTTVILLTGNANTSVPDQ